jgi:anti-sigma regulatory factor (Ser/Thr protein kinase)
VVAGLEDVAWFRLEDASVVGDVRRTAAAVGKRLGFSPERVGEVSIIATELAHNAVVHGTAGTALVRIHRHAAGPTLDLLVADSGPGIVDLATALADGESSRGTLGVGLGAARRLANHFEIYSTAPSGTVVWAQVGAQSAAVAGPSRIDGLTRPIAGEVVCGDAWAGAEAPERIAVLIADGLGHGELAAQASRAAIEAFSAQPWLGSRQLIELAHQRLQGGRGAAALAVELDLGSRVLSWTGVGNIAGRVLGPARTINLASRPGIVGQRMPRLQEEQVPLEDGSVVVLHSDGLTTKWTMERWRGLVVRSPTVIAGALLQWAGLRQDDASIVAIRDR